MSSLFSIIEKADLTWKDDLPFSSLYDDVYFSRQDGYQEKYYVFIEGNQLPTRWTNLLSSGQTSFCIGEIGFGTGLNFLVAWQTWLRYAPQDARLYFFSCEKHPINKADLAKCLQLWPQLSREADQLLIQYPVLIPGFHQLSFEQGRVVLNLMLGDAQHCYNQMLACGDYRLEPDLRNKAFDAWFLDGFAPAKNEQMWSADLYETIALLSKHGTTLATYSAASLVKNGLQAVGFYMHKLKGYARKRHMLTGEFVKHSQSKKKRSTPWYLGLPVNYINKEAIVIGAGLAGCYTAYALAQRGWSVKLIDSENEPGCGASGNEQAVLYPKLSVYRSPLTELMLTAFLYALRVYKPLAGNQVEGELKGIFQLAFNAKEEASQEHIRAWLEAYPELGICLDAEAASKITGLELEHGGMLIPGSGWINSRQLCAYLANQPGITCLTNTSVSKLKYVNNLWQAGEHGAPVVVIATGYQAAQYEPTSYLPLKAIPGQMTMLQSNAESESLKIPLCGDGHLLPVKEGRHTTGATYHLQLNPNHNVQVDNLKNLEKMGKLTPSINFNEQAICDHWQGIRAATTDYLPVVGPVANDKEFMQHFAGLAANSKRVILEAAKVYPGLYLCAGFGSRGLTTIPLCADWLASHINGEPSSLSQSMIKSISPARFLYKKVIRGDK